MKIYHHDSDGLFFGVSVARLDPLETKKQKKPVHLLPANATFTAPPEIPEGKLARWTGVVWLLEDVPVIVEEVPESPPEPTEEDLNAAREMQAHQVKINEAVERVRLAKAKGLKAADSPKVLEDLMFIMGV